MAKRSYEEWCKLVDAACKKAYGVGMGDLDDMNTIDWYEDGVSPSVAAKRLWRNATCQ